MIDVEATETFTTWQRKLRDERASEKIIIGIARLRRGLGDVKPAGGPVSELRIDYGPGYRIYFTRRGETLIILLCGGDKGSQGRDIRKAQKMAAELE